jgi:hypothetical protein
MASESDSDSTSNQESLEQGVQKESHVATGAAAVDLSSVRANDVQVSIQSQQPTQALVETFLGGAGRVLDSQQAQIQSKDVLLHQVTESATGSTSKGERLVKQVAPYVAVAVGFVTLAFFARGKR